MHFVETLFSYVNYDKTLLQTEYNIVRIAYLLWHQKISLSR